MAKVHFEVRGVDELFRQLDGFDPSIKRAKAKALNTGADVLLKQMQANVEPHIRSGRLSKALKIKKRGGDGVIDVGVFGNDAPHTHLVEFGHGGPKPAPAYPMLEPAYNETADEISDAIMRELGDAIEGGL